MEKQVQRAEHECIRLPSYCQRYFQGMWELSSQNDNLIGSYSLDFHNFLW